mgnify:CR=1 FL=1
MGGTEMQFFKLVGAFAAGSGGQGRKRTADENVDLLAAKSEAFNKGPPAALLRQWPCRRTLA